MNYSGACYFWVLCCCILTNFPAGYINMLLYYRFPNVNNFIPYSRNLRQAHSNNEILTVYALTKFPFVPKHLVVSSNLFFKKIIRINILF